MKPLRIFRHEVCEPPAYFCTYLDKCGLAYEIVCLDEGVTVPEELDDIAGLVFMGGAGGVDDPKNWISQELELIRQADKRGLPVLGICFGAQLISKALGGSVYCGESMEIGWHRIEAVIVDNTNCHAENPWLIGLPLCFEAFQWHGYTFSIPPDAIPLWRSACFANQGFARNRILGMQFHLEVTAETILELSRLYASDLKLSSDCVQTVDQLTDNLLARTKQLHQLADRIYERWLTMAGLVKVSTDSDL